MKYIYKRKINNISRQWKYSVIVILVILTSTSCKKLVQVTAPSTSLTGTNVYGDNATAASVLTGIYATIGNGRTYAGNNGISLRSGLSADELVLYSGGYNGGSLQQLYENRLTAQAPIALNYWQEYYKQLLTINSAIEGLNASESLSPAVKKQLLGEAKFLHAFYNFYLLNFYGDVPLALSSDWKINAVAHRTPSADIYEHIISDLKEAQNLLSEKYIQSDAVTEYGAGAEERVRPTRWTAIALLARVYLYTQEWANAEIQSSLLINNSNLYELNTLDAAFTKNNKEAIWQIQYVNKGSNTEGYHFILTSSPNNTAPTFLSDFLLNAFETGDNRKSHWVKSFTNGTNTWHYPFKYKAQSNPNNTEYFMVLRLGEQYLIRAEARAHLDKINESQADLNIIRSRAGLANTAAANQSTLLPAILHERQVELFTEWGHRWFDLKRTGTIDSVMTTVLPVKRPGFTWNTNWKLYPLSSEDIRLNPNLAPNNAGY